MEEIRKNVIKLNRKFENPDIADETMEKGINCNIKNVEAQKNYTLNLNEIIGVIENVIKPNTNKRDKKEMAPLDDRIGSN